MHTSVLMFAPFVLLLVTAALWDLTTYTIPNVLSLVLLMAFGVYAVSSGYTFSDYGSHALAALLALVAGFTLFAFGYIGGGDAKLFAAVAAWFGLHDLPEYLVFASLFGGALTLALLGLRQWPLPAGLAGRAWITNLHDPKAGIPYGVALAAGGLAVLPYTDIFHAAAH